MKKSVNIVIAISLMVLLAYTTSCRHHVPKHKDSFETVTASKVTEVLEKYVSAWLANNEQQVMNLMEENAMIQPNSLQPIQGREQIREFWFPKDSSTTLVNRFDTDLIHLELKDTIAFLTYESLLDWDYQKDSISFGMIQRGINTTIYRLQQNQEWKIWRSMWSDIEAHPK